MSKKDDVIRALLSAVSNGDARIVDAGVIEAPGDGTSAQPSYPKDVEARVLLDTLPHAQRECPFQVGDLVEQIPEFDKYRYPGNGLAIVSRLVKDVGLKENGLPIDFEDMVILVRCRRVDGETSWAEFAVESWRFRKYEGPIA